MRNERETLVQLALFESDPDAYLTEVSAAEKASTRVPCAPRLDPKLGVCDRVSRA